MLRGSINKSDSLARTPYTQYTSPRTAGFTQDTLNSNQAVRDMQGDTAPQFSSAAGMTQTGGTYDKNYFNDNFMNPNMSAVYDDMARRSNLNLTEKILPGVNNTFTGGGQFGSSRTMDFNNRAIRDQQDTLAGQMATAGQAAWDSGQKAYSDWGTKGIQAGSALGTLAGQEQAAGYKDATALDTIGRAQQGQTQANLDVAYQDFQNQQNWDKDQAGWLAGIVRGYSPPPAQQASMPVSTQQIAGSSPLASLAGGLTSGIAATQPQVRAKCGGLISMKRGRK